MKLPEPQVSADNEIVVVVPTKNASRTLRRCLISLREQTAPCSIVVVDNYSTDDTTSIARELADVVLECGPERSAQRNRGAEALASSIIGFIDADMELTPDVVADAVLAIQSGAVAVVVPERTVGTGFWSAVRAYERSFYRGVASIEAPRFFPRWAFECTGGFDEAMTGGEDWDLGKRVQSLGPTSSISSEIVHDEGHVRFFNACAKKAYYAEGVMRYLRIYGQAGFRGALDRPWLLHPRTLLCCEGIGLIALKAGEAVAMCWWIARKRIKLAGSATGGLGNTWP